MFEQIDSLIQDHLDTDKVYTAEALAYVCSFILRPADRLLFCTDGLTDMLADGDIAAISKNETDPQPGCKALVNAANSAGGHDNITLIIIDWLG